jgi:hypothetical protein
MGFPSINLSMRAARVTGASAGCLLALMIDSSVQVEQAGGQRIPGIVPAAAA